MNNLENNNGNKKGHNDPQPERGNDINRGHKGQEKENNGRDRKPGNSHPGLPTINYGW